MRLRSSRRGSVSVLAENGFRLHREGSSAFQEGPVASKTTEMKIQANANVLIYNEKDGCGQSRMFMSADLEMISLQTSGQGSRIMAKRL